jgi:hypothetical protein
MNRSNERRNTRKLPRAFSALFLAAVIFSTMGAAVFDSLGSPKELETVSEENIGDYVSQEVYFILDYYAEEGNSSGGDASGRYAVVPQGGMLVTYLIPDRYFDSMDTVLNDTYAWLNGEIDSLDKYFIVNGTVDRLDSTTEGLFYEWFNQSHDWMADAGLIDASEDYANYLSPYIIKVGYIGAYPAILAYVLSAFALFCLVYFVIGVYLSITRKQKAGAENKTHTVRASYRNRPGGSPQSDELWDKKYDEKPPWEL